jgi:hypothetical protein
MITLFENFSIPFKLNDYIKQEDGVFKIPNIKFEFFSEKALANAQKNEKYYTQIRYNSLMRLFLYVKLLRYSGDSPIILSYIQGLKEKDAHKIEIINKIPNNNHVFNMVNKNYKLGFTDYKYDNLQDLKKFILNWETILNDRNILEFISMIFESSKSASKSEKIVRGVLSMLYSKYYELTYAKLEDDLKGMDLWKINRSTGERNSIQVKNIRGKVKFTIKGDTIYINNTSIDLHNYECWNSSLPYEYLVFYLEEEKKICVIKSSAIFAINKNSEKRSIVIKLKNWAMTDKFYSKVVKLLDVPKRFVGKDVGQIFYTPELEFEVPKDSDSETPEPN